MNASCYTVNNFKACHYEWSMSCIWAIPWPWVMSCVWISHVTYECVTLHGEYLQVMSLWMIHVVYMGYTVTMSHVTCMNESCHISMRHVTRLRTWRHIPVNDLCRVYELNRDHESYHVYKWVMSRMSCYTVNNLTSSSYGVATVSRINWIIVFFCRISSLL